MEDHLVDLPILNRSFMMLKNKDESNFKEALAIVQRCLRTHLSTEGMSVVVKRVRRLHGNFCDRYVGSHRNKNMFEKKHSNWLDTPVQMPSSLVQSSSPNTESGIHQQEDTGIMDEPSESSGTSTSKSNFSVNEAFALLSDLSLTKEQYERLRIATQDKGHEDLLPPYDRIEQAKSHSQ